MSPIATVIFDFIGTLTSIENYEMENSKIQLYCALNRAGFNLAQEDFMQAYDKAQDKYHKIRYEQLIEVTNAIWTAEALNALGTQTSPNDPRIKAALSIFFRDYVKDIMLRPFARKILQRASVNCKLGLISNFTYAPVIYAGLRKLNINRYFRVVLVSDAVGWRKPHPKIFEEALRRLDATPEQTLYVGDSPLEDIKGAKALGMKTIFVPSQFYTSEFLKESQQKPDIVVKDLCQLYEEWPKIINCLGQVIT